jgi:predicted amidophosphoribosyltransferase
MMGEECMICTEQTDFVTSVTLNCFHTHVFHTDCLKQWVNINPICPTCREPVSRDILHRMVQQEAVQQDLNNEEEWDEEFDQYGSYRANPYS